MHLFLLMKLVLINIQIMQNMDKNDGQNDEPKHWKLGLFYFNKKDTRILLPKRINQLGWTLNFGRWQVWLVIIIIIIMIVWFNKLS